MPKSDDHDPPIEPTPRWLQRAVRGRFILLGLHVVVSAGWYCVFLSGFDPLGVSVVKNSDTDSAVISYVVGTLILFGMQFLFLLGAPHVRWPRPRRKRSIFVSLAIGSLIALLLTAGTILALASLYQLIYRPDSFHSGGLPASQTSTESPWEPFLPWIISGVALGGWIFWFLIFALVGSGQWSTRFRWMYRVLIAGTVIELLITIPIDIQIRRKTNCYCGEGTFLALVIGLTAVVWTFGPAVALLFLIRRRQLISRQDYCQQCGYNLHGLDSVRCPECGRPFKAALI